MTLTPVLVQKRRSDLIKQLFELASVLQGSAQGGDHFRWGIHTTASPFLGEGEDKGGMFMAPGASAAVGSHTGFSDFGEGAFDDRPKALELLKELLTEGV